MSKRIALNLIIDILEFIGNLLCISLFFGIMFIGGILTFLEDRRSRRSRLFYRNDIQRL
jgi:hypothetical protein